MKARCIMSIEAVYRLYRFQIFSMYPPILQMQVHLPGMHMVPFNDEDNLEDVLERTRNQRSMLTEFFRMNSEDPNTRRYLYKEFLEHYTWNKSKKVWFTRKRSYQIGRLVYAYPSEGERFYLQVLLNHVRGPTSFISIRTVRGVVSPTFRECCEKLGLIETDRSLDNALSEAVAFQMPCALRRIFATIMVFCEYTNIRTLWDKHFESMAEDYVRVHGNSSSVEQFILKDIADILSSMGKDIRNYGLPHMHKSGETSLLETLDRSLRDITGYDLPFGGKVMVFGEDFRQVLPVVPRGTRAQICDATLLQSYIWDDIKIIRLKQNMMTQNDV
ncbi:hypothetical protein PVAP13_8KG259500 [Panicum virgatum]|uniref:ATP-dependent DNA helicase n=1 Tax=Panicum virgatum TaxID=38727 RepID=A0A8T0PKD5_PANVG|nr:hypothetical protein PVAP13_8KG259500 [Panicum virgatum]